MTNPCSSHGTPSHQRMPQQVNKWARDTAYTLMTLLQPIYPYVFYIAISFRSSTRTKWKWYDWAGEARECVNYILHLVPPPWSSAKLIWICYYSKLLVYLSGKFAATLQLGESLPNISFYFFSPQTQKTHINAVVIILPITNPYLWSEWNRSYHPNSV